MKSEEGRETWKWKWKKNFRLLIFTICLVGILLHHHPKSECNDDPRLKKSLSFVRVMFQNRWKIFSRLFQKEKFSLCKFKPTQTHDTVTVIIRDFFRVFFSRADESFFIDIENKMFFTDTTQIIARIHFTVDCGSIRGMWS